MINYIIRRLLLLPLTLFCIVLVNFVIINLAPGDPTTVTELSKDGGAQKQEQAASVFGSDFRFLQFREHFGLTLPILFNLWPLTSEETVLENVVTIATQKDHMPFKEYTDLKVYMGDKARFIMPHLANILQTQEEPNIQEATAKLIIRGGTKQAYLGPDLTPEQKAFNRKTAKNNQFLIEQLPFQNDTKEALEKKFTNLLEWYQNNRSEYQFDRKEILYTFFFETRFFRYMSRIATLDFGTLRDDSNKTVISEVLKRFKYSLTLSIIPMLLTFFLCIVIGFTMALYHEMWPDYSLNLACLILYAIPIFVVAPFLIEEVALNHTFPFTNIPIPISGFTSPERIYENMTSLQRLFDIIRHITLPIIAIIYGSLAAQSRLARTAVLEVMRQDYVRTARSKGVSPAGVTIKHIGRNAAITIVTSIAGSLGIVLTGSLIVETVFEINGFGKFFYDAVINRDYNVIMFSALAGSFLTLLGYLVADITYTVLDPRVSLD